MKPRGRIKPLYLGLAIGLIVSGLILFAGKGQAQSSELIPVIITLKSQPQEAIARQVWSQTSPQIQAVQEKIRQTDPIHAAMLVEGKALSASQEADLIAQVRLQPANTQAQNQIDQMAGQIDSLRNEARQQIRQRIQVQLESSQAPVAQEVQALGGQVTYRYQVLNAIAASVPAEAISALQALPEVAGVSEDQARELLLNVSAASIGAPTFWNLGYTGGGVDVAVVDTGIDGDHPALGVNSFVGHRCLVTADIYTNSEFNDPTANDVNGHGTHVGGTIGSQNSTYRGVSSGLRTLINAKAGFDTDGADLGTASMYDSDAMDCVDWALNNTANGTDVFNLSFGSLAGSDDNDYQRFWDAVVDQEGAVAAIAAGNAGGPDHRLYSPSIAYNVISVANINDGNTFNSNDYYGSRGDDVLNSTSSIGPTPGGRKKPDLAAPGTAICSTDNSWETTGINPNCPLVADYISYSGTSMATPHVVGAAALVMSRGVSNPKAVKALLINTAQDKGTAGWDAGYGWGYVDLQNLSAHINDYFVASITAAPDFRLYSGPALSGDAASLVWDRRVGYNGDVYPSTWYALTNLDLLAYDEASDSLVQSSTSTIDNVEQVRFSSDLAEVVLKVDAISASIAGAASEEYALATQEGFTLRQGPRLMAIGSVTGNLAGPAGTVITLSVTMRNGGDLKSFGNSFVVDPTPGLTQTSGSSLSQSLADLDVNESDLGSYSWTFQKGDDLVQFITINFSSNSYGETFNSSSFFSPYVWYFPIIGH